MNSLTIDATSALITIVGAFAVLASWIGALTIKFMAANNALRAAKEEVQAERARLEDAIGKYADLRMDIEALCTAFNHQLPIKEFARQNFCLILPSHRPPETPTEAQQQQQTAPVAAEN